MTKIIHEDNLKRFKDLVKSSPSSLIISMDDEEFFQKFKLWLHFNMLKFDEELYPNLFTKNYFFSKDSRTDELFEQVAKITKFYPVNDVLMFVKISDNYMVANLNYYNSDELVAVPVDLNESKIMLIKKNAK